MPSERSASRQLGSHDTSGETPEPSEQPEQEGRAARQLDQEQGSAAAAESPDQGTAWTPDGRAATSDLPDPKI